MTPIEQLRDRLQRRLGDAEASAVAGGLPPDATATVVELLDELEAASERVFYDAVTGLGTLHREGGLEHVVPWLDLGVAITGASGASGLRYFRESPALLRAFETREAAGRALHLALELAEQHPNVALEFVRRAPGLAAVLPLDELGRWADVGLELADVDYVLAMEYLRQSPALATVLPWDQVRAWVGFGMKLVTQNSLGKTDYFATLEFFRSSPNILEDVEPKELRGLLVRMGDQIAGLDTRAAIELLSEAPALIRSLPSEGWARRVLQYGGLIAERDVGATLSFLRRCPELLALLGGADADRGKFEEWFRSGMEVLEYSAEGGRAYFATETRKALASVTQALSGVPLRQVARSLQLFVQGLCGTDVDIQAAESSDAEGEAPRASVSGDGRAIALPALLRRYPTREENVRLYTVMAAHEAGHLEFGTYRLALDRLDDLLAEVRRRYGRAADAGAETLEEAFALYPQPALMRDLWTVLEDARVEARLQREYPGLREHLAAQARDSVSTRTLTHGLSVREMVVDHLLLMTTRDPSTVEVPQPVRELVDRAWAVAQTVLDPAATAEDAVRKADRIYGLLEQAVPPRERPEGAEEPRDTPRAGGPAASDAPAGDYQPVSEGGHRGRMRPELIRRQGTAPEQEGLGGAGGQGATPRPPRRPGEAGAAETGTPPPRQPARAAEAVAPRPDPLPAPSSLSDEVLGLPDERRPAADPGERAGGRFVYDEWDGVLQDYRAGWCRVLELEVPEGGADFADQVLSRHGPLVRLVRRYFEAIRPEGLRRIPGQPEGEDIDLDAAVRRRIEQRAGAEATDRIYVRRERRERDVAVAVLVDLSGSTSRAIDEGGRRVIDVEKEGLVLLTEALEAIGDQYAIYGYSGRGRQQVEFLVFKDFDAPRDSRAMARLGAAAPRHQNRDGAAIRHALRKLAARPAKVRLLVLISDGKPLDDGYADEYSLEDTKMALREARTRGIEPFCITVDRSADDYLRRMYGDVRYVVVDRVASLPERLPRIYQRLTA